MIYAATVANNQSAGERVAGNAKTRTVVFCIRRANVFLCVFVCLARDNVRVREYAKTKRAAAHTIIIHSLSHECIPQMMHTHAYRTHSFGVPVRGVFVTKSMTDLAAVEMGRCLAPLRP